MPRRYAVGPGGLTASAEETREQKARMLGTACNNTLSLSNRKATEVALLIGVRNGWGDNYVEKHEIKIRQTDDGKHRLRYTAYGTVMANPFPVRGDYDKVPNLPHERGLCPVVECLQAVKDIDGRNKMFQQTLVAWTLSFMITSSWGHIGGQALLQNVKDIKPQKYCGPMLANTLALICYEENAGVGKRSEYNSIYNADVATLYKEQEIPYWPWLSVEKARSMGLPSRGKRYVGVVDECCFKACSVDELMSYC